MRWNVDEFAQTAAVRGGAPNCRINSNNNNDPGAIYSIVLLQVCGFNDKKYEIQVRNPYYNTPGIGIIAYRCRHNWEQVQERVTQLFTHRYSVIKEITNNLPTCSHLYKCNWKDILQCQLYQRNAMVEKKPQVPYRSGWRKNSLAKIRKEDENLFRHHCCWREISPTNAKEVRDT